MLEELRGKGWRVLGYFLWMLGAGIVLDGESTTFGSLLLAAGVASFLAGLVQEPSLPVESGK
jgi:hypothetical protein